MSDLDTGLRRLHNQRISHGIFEKPSEVVQWLGAIQAQDYLGSLWALGLRTKEATEADIEQAVADRKIIRTWPMRGTLHFVSPEDVRWMLQLLTPRVIARSAGRYRQLELNEEIFSRSRDLLIKALEGGRQLTRSGMFQVLEQNNIVTSGQRGIHILNHLAQQCVLCLGAREGKQPTFVLLDEWLPQSRILEGDEAMAELALRYFTSHGPAGLEDFVWWAGLLVAEARAGLETVKAQLVEEKRDGKTYWMSPATLSTPRDTTSTYLLPPFDEYLLGYKDRSMVLEPQYAKQVNPGSNGMFSPIIVIEGQVVGTWRRTLKKNTVTLDFKPFTSLTPAETNTVHNVAQRYGEFLGLSVVLS